MVKLKKRKLNPYKVAKIAVIALLFLAAPFVISNIVRNEDKTFITVVDSLEIYNYELRETDTDYQKEIFNSLKELLNSDDIDDLEYAKYLGKLFIADFYTMDTKFNNQDVGGSKFIHDDMQESFVEYAKESVYAHVQSKLIRERNQNLPIVSNVELLDIEKNELLNDNFTYEATFKVTYSNIDNEEVKPPENVFIVFDFIDDKLVIVDFTTDVETKTE